MVTNVKDLPDITDGHLEVLEGMQTVLQWILRDLRAGRTVMPEGSDALESSIVHLIEARRRVSKVIKRMDEYEPPPSSERETDEDFEYWADDDE